MKFVALLMVLHTLHLIQSEEKINNCGDLKEETCAFCLQKPGCAWCSDEKYSGDRCNTTTYHQKNLCPSNHTINPQPSQKPEEHPGSQASQTSPRKVKLTLRVDEPVIFTVKVKPAKNYPVDLYYLMDLSATMKDDLLIIKALAGNISKTLSSLTNKQRLAFGSFVDKETPPYLKYEDINKEFCPGCDIPYDFKHVLNFTDSEIDFENGVQNVKHSGNHDIPEGTLDALMQVAACDGKINWGPSKTTRRILLVATDGLFHMAADGKLGAIIEPNDAKCHLARRDDGVYYSKSLEMDYPSVNQVFKKLRESSIHPIFAIPKGQGDSGEMTSSTYKSLVSSWNKLSATFGELDDDSGNILELIKTSYNKIVSTVQITYTLPEGIKINIKPNCGNARTLGEKCLNVKLGNEVSFDISVTATAARCDKGNSTSFKLLATGFGEVQVDLSIICSCLCQDKKVYNSSVCGGNGTLVCGRCDCNDRWSGRKCQCDSSKIQISKDRKCKTSNESTTVCEGNGDCDCEECRCYFIGSTGKKYYGTHCQCSDFNCEQYNNKLCGGPDRGECKCGQCRCKSLFIGSNCGEDNCAKKIESCLVDEATVNCSGHGTCDCGTCKCDTFYTGDKCERCPTCLSSCGDFKQCVLCKVFGYVPENKTTCANCPKITELDSIDKFGKNTFKCPSKDSDGCTYNFAYGTEEGTDNITVYAVTKKECPEGPDVLLIVLAVIAGIVGIGIILLLLWKLLTAMVDRREYQKFEQDRAKSKWHREKNPLYQPATSTVQNPTFVGARKE